MINQDDIQKNSLRIIEWSILAVIFFTPIYFAFFQENFSVFDLNKSAWLRLCLFTAMSAWLIFVSVSGQIPRFNSKKIFWSWLILLIAFSVSTVFSLHPQISFLGSYERHQGLYNLVFYLLTFLFIINFFHSQEHFKKILVTLNVSAAVICLYGLTQALGLDFLYWSEASFTRIFSTFGQPNFFGHYLVVVIPLTIYSLFYISKKFLVRSLFLLLLISEVVCLFFTLSRGAWIAIGLTIFIAGIYLLFKFKKKLLASALIIIFVLSTIVLLMPSIRFKIVDNYFKHDVSIVSRVVSIIDFSSGSSAVRFKYLKAAWEIFTEAPLYRKLFGFGPDVLADVFVGKYQPDWGYYEQINSFPDRAHNNFFDNLLQFGLIGWLSLLSFVFICIKPLFNNFKKQLGSDFWLAIALGASLVAYTINNFFSFSLTAMSLLFFVLLALALRFGEGYQAINFNSITIFRPLSRWIISLTSIIFLLVLFFSYDIKPLIADYYYIKVKRDEAANNCYGILNNLESTMSWYSISHFYNRVYLTFYINCFLSASSDEAKQKIIKNVLDQIAVIPEKEKQFYSFIDLSHAYSILGYYDDPKYYSLAEINYKKMLELGPNVTTAYQDYGRMKLWQAKYEEARKIFFDGVAVVPPLDKATPNSQHTSDLANQLSYFYYLIGLTYKYENNFDQAIEAYKKSISIDPKVTSSYKDLSDIARKEGKINDAIAYFKQAFAIEPTEVFWPLALANLYLEQKDRESAWRYAKKAYELNPDDSKVKEVYNKLK